MIINKYELEFLLIIFRQIYLSINRVNESEKDAYFTFFESRMKYYIYAKRLLNKKMHREGMKVSFFGVTKVHLEYITMYETLNKFIFFVKEKPFPAYDLRNEIFNFVANIYSYLESKISFRDKKKYAYIEHYNQNDLNGQFFDTIEELLNKLGYDYIIRDIYNITDKLK